MNLFDLGQVDFKEWKGLLFLTKGQGDLRLLAGKKALGVQGRRLGGLKRA
ncbi:MAG: hypothetical protein JW847_04460 [Candidatus Omnitrophica bacterium]|nr:hypothetical protein [Candidatus Omnitrophota bacterium]